MEQQCLDNLARAVLQAADQNADEKLERGEWALIVTAVMHASTATGGSSPADDDVPLENLLDFSHVDADASGFIDREEVLGLFRALQEIWGFNKLAAVLDLVLADVQSPAKQLEGGGAAE